MTDLHVYEIGRFAIAAKSAEHALSEYLEADGENLYVGDIEEGEAEIIEIRIERMTVKQIAAKTHPCCADGCPLCDAAQDWVYISYQDMIDKCKPGDFPCVIAEGE